jgi:HEAT repeat protein
MRRPSGDIDRLIADLQSSDSIRRDAAVARLRILGTRASPRLIELAAAHESASVRAQALDALEGLDDVRVIDAAFDALRDGDIDVVIAGLGVLRRWVAEETGTRLLDAITAIAVDRARDARVRVAALAALSELPEHLLRPIRDQAPPPESAGPSLDDPVAVREWIQAYGANATLNTLHELVTRTREREHDESSSRLRSEWLQARGRAHQALARRESRVALYDLRETFEAATSALPQSFISTAAAIGDATCLEPLARAWAASGRDVDWKHQLSTTAATIMRREKLTGRSAAVKKLRANYPEFV